MLLNDTIGSAASALRAHKMRSALTMLGVIIGVGSVVLMVSVGKSFQRYILDQIASFSSNLVEVYPTGFEKFGGSTDSLTEDDFRAVEKLTTVQTVAPVIFITEKTTYGSEELSPWVFGTTKNFFANYGLKLQAGRLLDDRDNSAASSVAVISSQTAEDLFGNRDPLGQRIQVGKKFYTVVGVLQSIGSPVLQDMDTPVYVPYSTARAVTGQKYLSYMTLRAVGDYELTVADITSLLRQRHSIHNPENDKDKDDFVARSAEQATEIVGQVTLGLTAFMGLIAGISLLVGGIGIMNIMLVSVTERTKEIGLRKAVGARRSDILRQFLFEAVFLTSLGGVIGILLGTALGLFLSAVAAKLLGSFTFVLSVKALFAAMMMAMGTGLVFGLYPAKKAASLSPMEAIRWD
ncbi:multidrug ABC transporter substrate-binding protein [Candidatus Peregrinibacteria bacterium CG10_big_fil_rev_8_21_14_0_10_49_10]|nr:MAG: multidrug ABC transporter substrate-binding protein [Candidatus Peregrinibacteria bacterium CG10_big_fil_rev_8_21_14_0_10_49_10]